MERIDVTKTFLPPLEDYTRYLQQIWDSARITNQGQFLQEFETKVSNYLGVSQFHFVSNGTIALQLALNALEITEGEIITTPFSYVATTSAILWERCTPVFVDIEPNTFCIDPDKIEAAITNKTKAIMAVHVFGFPCEVAIIEAIAEKHKLKVIYDGAHAFGVTYQGKSLLSYGDVSICSFHATKLFHTIEGGCVITKSKKLSNRTELIKHFGHVGDKHYMLGINAKASELQAAMGLCNLDHIDEIIAARKAASESYDHALDAKFRRPVLGAEVQRNYAYYPVVFESEAQLLKAFKALNAKNIFPRRYFYPSLNTLPYVQGQSCPISEDIASRIACLPLFVGLKTETIAEIASTLRGL
jgi:dTDP-4-amino-4,6-dideoxygalactose transaminase